MADGFQFEFTPAVEQATAFAWEKVKRQVTPIEWRLHAPLSVLQEFSPGLPRRSGREGLARPYSVNVEAVETSATVPFGVRK